MITDYAQSKTLFPYGAGSLPGLIRASARQAHAWTGHGIEIEEENYGEISIGQAAADPEGGPQGDGY
jgi:hypothetical protein